MCTFTQWDHLNILPSNVAIGFTEPFSTSRVGPGDLFYSALWRRQTSPQASFRLLPLLSEVGGCCSLFLEKQTSLEFAICSSESCPAAVWFLWAGLLAVVFLVTTNEWVSPRQTATGGGGEGFILPWVSTSLSPYEYGPLNCIKMCSPRGSMIDQGDDIGGDRNQHACLSPEAWLGFAFLAQASS